MPLDRDQVNGVNSVEGDVLPNLVTDRDRIVLLAEPRQQLRSSRLYTTAAWIERGLLLKTIALVLEAKTLRSASSVTRQCGGSECPTSRGFLLACRMRAGTSSQTG